VRAPDPAPPTSERWQQIKAIVAEALEENSTDARAALIAERCGCDPALREEVESLLDQTTGALENFAEKAAAPLRRDRSRLEAGQRMGPWAIVRELGLGGMGAVYLAERADGAFEKRVAIKVLKRGTDTDEILRRFEAERQILARLDHPNITRLIDAGTTDDGLPYVVMDYVVGKPITQYAGEKQLSVPDRLKLFRAVCSAVTYAHQNLVVHRDLKPSNILVTENGEVRLLDFGIAKLLSDAEASGADMTITALRVMTPEYASPEQIKGEPITTLSDVYSLGVCLYELLTGARPYKLTRKTPDELSKAICEQAPQKPSTAVGKGDGNSKLETRNSKILKGDLDNIVLMALSKEPARRYASVEQFSEDVRRHLEGLPVRARQATAAYRAAKFVARHKIGVTAVAAIVLVLLIGIAATAWQWTVARAERAKAEARFEILRKSSRTMISEIHGALMNLSGSLEARKLLLQRATEQLDALAAESANDPRLQVDLADAYQNIGYLPDKPLAERTELFKKAIALDEKVLARDPKHIAARENLAMSKINLADFARAQGDSSEALKYNREAIALLESVVADEPAEMEHKKTLWNASYNAALSLMQAGRAAEALEICQRIYPVAVELREKHTADQSDHRFRRPYLSRALAANSLTYLGRYDEAITEIRTALQETATVRQKFPLGPFERLDESIFTYRLAIALERSGRRDEAIETMTRSLGMAEALMNDEPKDISYRTTAAFENSLLASVLLRARKLPESIKYFRRAIELYEKILAADAEQKQARADLAYGYGGLGLALAQTGNATEGLAAERTALSSYEKLEAARSSNVGLLRDYAETLDRAGQTCLLNATNNNANEAKQFFQQSLVIWTEMRDRGTLSKVDANKPDEIQAEIAKCDAALK
jgi:non-specific serine/threonine protein kinase/serine/threonine-protein kinase